MIRFSFRYFDWLLLGCVFVLAAASLITLASISSLYFSRQIFWYGLGFLVFLVASQINWQWLLTQGWFRHGFYWLSILLLIVPLLQSRVVRGTKSWIFIGDFQFGPSELAKIALIFILAGFFSRHYLAAWQMKNIIKSLFYAMVPIGIIVNHPDFGSALVVAGIWFGFLLMSGINRKRFLVGLGLLVLVFLILWFNVLAPYQKDRIKAFVFPDFDPLGVSYHVVQSKIAIGSAGFWGKGFNLGTQTQLDFLPEAHTDFIFAAFVEEWGILGGIILILTYMLMISRITFIGLKVRRNDLKFLTLGAGLVFLIHIFVNLGSNIGLVPVVGISLPFVSYGGSNLLTSLMLIGIIERIKIESSY